MSTQKLAIISGNGLHIFNIQDKTCQNYISDNSSIYEALYDNTGRYFCYCSNNGCFLIDLQTDKKSILNSSSRCRKLCFSPKGTYISIFSLLNGTTDDNNVFVYETKTCTQIHSYKYNNSGTWAPQWSADEKMSIKILKSEVLLFTEQSLDKFNGKINIKGLERAAISMCNNEYHIATFIKGTQGMPNMVKIFKYPNLREPINNRSFFKATDVYLKWSPNGKSLLFLVHVEDTKTNYYGENSLYFMAAEIGGETALVTMPKDDNYVHNVEWQPITGDKFVVTYGNPVSAAVFNTKCALIYHIDSPNRNICHFSSCGKLLAMVGVGNVRGSLQVWNFQTNKMIGEMDIPDVNKICWSGNDQYLVSATVSPSLRVNNGVIVWNTDGEIVVDKLAVNELIKNPSEVYNVLWQPSVTTSCDSHDHCKKTTTGSYYFNAQYQRFKEKPAGKLNTVYVPPHLRNRGGDNNNTGGNGSQTVQTGLSIKFTPDLIKPQSANKPKKKKNKNKSTTAVTNNNNVAAP